MTTKELIRREIERRKVDALDKGFTFVPTALQDLLSFLDTLPDEPVTDCHDLTEAAEKSARQYYVDGGYSPFPNIETASHIAGFKAGAEWQKRKMMEGAVEGEVCGRCYGHLNIRFADGVYKYLEPKNISHIPADVLKYNIGDKVKIIIVKEDER